MNLSGMRYRFTLRYCLSLLVVVGGLGGLLGQSSGMQLLKIQASKNKEVVRSKAVCDSDPGTVVGFKDFDVSSNVFGTVDANSTVAFDDRPAVIYLCAGDRFTIDHLADSENLIGDPDPSTKPGVAFALYDCEPTIEGETYTEIDADECHPDIVGFDDLDGTTTVFEPVDYFNDNYDLIVDNIDQPTVAQIFGVPNLIYVAPITIDSLAQRGFVDEAGANGNPGCAKVSTDQAIALSFLNPIEARDINPSTTDCSGSFSIFGGISEALGTTAYTITLTNVSSGEVTVVDESATYQHGDLVDYTVPSPGEYRITIEDDISCGATDLVTHTATCATPPSADLEFEVDKTNISCLGLDDGTISVTITGGTAPYEIRYVNTTPTPPVPGSVTAPTDGLTTIEGLSSGSYRVTVFDNAGEVSGPQEVTILPADISVEIEVVQPIQCFNESNGILRAVIFDATNEVSSDGYTFQWAGPNGFTASTAEIDQVGPGEYSVTSTSPDGCVSSASRTLRAPSQLLIQNDTGDPNAATCQSVADGSINRSISGGTRDANDNYTITWSDGVVTTSRNITRDDLLPGTYTVSVTDANGCDPVSTTFLVEAVKTIVLTASTNGVSCFGEVDGNIVVSASTEGADADLPFRARVLNQDGTVAQPFRELDGDGSTPTAFADLPPGEYIVVLKDSDSEGCETQQAITITEPELLEITAVNTTDVGCPDEAGTATIDVTGGTGPYTYRFRNDSLPNPADSTLTFDSTTVVSTTVDSTMLNTIGDLQADTNYVVFVTDSRGCVDSMTFFINSPPRATIQPIVPATVSCPESTDGQLTVVATPPQGDTIEITIDKYEWFRLNPDNTLGEKVADGRTTGADLTVGAYVVQITLSNDCTSFGFGQVSSPGLVMIDSITTIDPSCIDDNNGSAFVSASGGTKPYTYRFSSASGPSAINNVNGLVPLDYTVTVTDANGCEPIAEGSFTINAPVSIVALPTITDVNCPSDSIFDGSITYDARFSNDSIGLFEFIWSTGDTVRNQTSATLNGLARGPVSVTITDGFCPQVFTDTIGSPEDFAFDIETESVTCNGLENGSAEIDVTGGTPAYTFEYVGRTETGTTLTDVPAGAYQLIVTDSRGCVADTFAFGIDEPDPLVLAIDQDLTTPLVTCAGDEDGIVAVQVVSNNNNPLRDNPYTWSPNVVDNDDEIAENLGPGDYTVSVTDSLGCTDTIFFKIEEPQPITFIVEQPLPPNCFGETTEITIDTAFGGQSSGLDDFTFTINNDGFLIRADQPGTTFAGETIITVFDSVGCTAQDTFDIRQPDEIIIDLEDRIVIELGDSLQQLNPIITPPNGEYAYRWTPDRFLSSDSIRNPFIFPTSDQEYTFEVTDSSGCSALEDVFVIVDANRNIYIPNGFSPNGDGRNDDFRIFGCRGVVGITQVNIFNRWGGLVYENSDLLANCLDGTLLWNGNNATLQGKPVDPGVYVYTIEVLFLDNETLTYRGDISVIR